MASIAGMWASSQISRYIHNRIDNAVQRFDKDDLKILTFEPKEIEQHDLNNLVQELSDQDLDIRILTQENVQHAYDDIQKNTTDRVWVIRHGTEPAACLDRNIITIFPYYFFDFTYEEKKAVMRHELQHAIEHHDQKLRSIWAPIYATGALMYALTSSMSIDGTPTHVRHFEMLGRLVSFGIIGCADQQAVSCSVHNGMKYLLIVPQQMIMNICIQHYEVSAKRMKMQRVITVIIGATGWHRS